MFVYIGLLQGLEKAIRGNLEQEITARAASSEPKNFKIVKATDTPSTSKKK